MIVLSYREEQIRRDGVRIGMSSVFDVFAQDVDAATFPLEHRYMARFEKITGAYRGERDAHILPHGVSYLGAAECGNSSLARRPVVGVLRGFTLAFSSIADPAAKKVASRLDDEDVGMLARRMKRAAPHLVAYDRGMVLLLQSFPEATPSRRANDRARVTSLFACSMPV